MKFGKMALAAMLAIGFGSSCAYAQVATFTAVISDVDADAGTISLTQSLPAAGTASDAPTATASYVASPVLIAAAAVGTTVQATVQLFNGRPAVTALATSDGVVSGLPAVDTSLAAASATSVAIDPASLTPAGAQ